MLWHGIFNQEQCLREDAAAGYYVAATTTKVSPAGVL